MKKDTILPFDLRAVQRITDKFGTPVYVYDEEGIRNQSKSLNSAFNWARGYKNFFAVKATPTPAILKILQEEGMGFDCSSRAELIMLQRMEVSGRDIFYTGNNTPAEDFELAIKMGAAINIDDFSQVPVFMKTLGSQEIDMVSVRYNPGHRRSGNKINGEPKEAKFGMPIEAVIESFSYLKNCKIKNFGLHSMVASNELDPRYFEESTRMLLREVHNIEQRVGIRFSFINLGGGFGVNYKTDQSEFDLVAATELIRESVLAAGREDLAIYTENGRYVTGPHGYLLTKAQYIMGKHKTFVGVDANTADWLHFDAQEPYRHITVMGREDETVTRNYDIVGSANKDDDKLTSDRHLPWVHPGDILAIHDVGGYAHSMNSGYNGNLRCAEVVLLNGEGRLVRKAQSMDDYFRNIIWP